MDNSAPGACVRAVRFRRRHLLGCLLVATLALTAATHCPGEQVVTNFDADQVDFALDHKQVTLRGNAHLFSQAATDASRFVRIDADVIEGDIPSGRFEMFGDVRIETPQGMMRGESALYNSRTAEFSLRRTAIMMPVTEVNEPAVCGFAYALEAAREGDVVYITRGRFTTCSHRNPHWALEADRFRWKPDTNQVVAYGGSVRLYGLEIPVFPRIPYTFGENERRGPDLLPFPTYSSRDGLRAGWSFDIGNPLDDPKTEVQVRWRELRPLQVSSRTTFRTGSSTWTRLHMGLREDAKQDIDRVVPLDTFPEVGIAGHWDLGDGDYALQADLSGGHYRQRPEDGLAEVTEDRARIQARLTANPDGIYEPGETWWWIDASEALYGNGSHYGTLGVGVGAAAELTDWFGVNAEVRQWMTAGASPFVWDDVDVKTEIESNTQLKLGDRWRVRFGARHDLEDGRLRSWDAELRRRVHCLTWKLSYSDIGDDLVLGVEIGGLFGNDEPPEDACPADGPPDFWATHGPERSARDTRSDGVSEAMETP